MKGRTRARRTAGLFRLARCARLVLLIFLPPCFVILLKATTLAIPWLSPVVRTQSMRRISARANGRYKSYAEFVLPQRPADGASPGTPAGMTSIKNTYFYVLTPAGERPIISGGVRHWWRIVLLVLPQVPLYTRAASRSRARCACDGMSGRRGRRG
jgi:hypothetical protein